MDSIDKRLLNLIQKDFPISPKPFADIGRKLELSEEEVIERISLFKKKGIIRRIGATFEPKRLGFTSTLCAARVPEEKIERFVEVVNSYPGVTHNYERNNDYNIWFTFIAESKEEIRENLREISERTGIMEIKDLPTLRRFKINVNFDMEKEEEKHGRS